MALAHGTEENITRPIAGGLAKILIIVSVAV
jgi:hypothetical protein